jgi:hypothetical protein
MLGLDIPVPIATIADPPPGGQAATALQLYQLLLPTLGPGSTLLLGSCQFPFGVTLIVASVTLLRRSQFGNDHLQVPILVR